MNATQQQQQKQFWKLQLTENGDRIGTYNTLGEAIEARYEIDGETDTEIQLVDGRGRMLYYDGTHVSSVVFAMSEMKKIYDGGSATTIDNLPKINYPQTPASEIDYSDDASEHNPFPNAPYGVVSAGARVVADYRK